MLGLSASNRPEFNPRRAQASVYLWMARNSFRIPTVPQ